MYYIKSESHPLGISNSLSSLTKLTALSSFSPLFYLGLLTILTAGPSLWASDWESRIQSLLCTNKEKTTPRSKAGEWPSGATRPALPAWYAPEDRRVKAMPNELDFPLLTKSCILSSWAKPDP